MPPAAAYVEIDDMIHRLAVDVALDIDLLPPPEIDLLPLPPNV